MPNSMVCTSPPLVVIRRYFLVGLAFGVFAINAWGQNPLIGRNEYPQFRQLSGLSGGGYGLSFDGWGSLSGPTAFSTPIGIALGHDQIRISGGETLFRGSTFSDKNSSGKASFMYGHSFGAINIAYSYFVKSNRGDASTNLQVSYNPGTVNAPSVSFGVQDIGGHGGAAGQGIPGDNALSRSWFGALTYEAYHGTNPVYLSGGWGTCRFSKGFASISAQVIAPLRLWTEYDGYGFNEGLLFAYRPSNRNEDGDKQHSFEADLLVGLIRGRYPTFGLTVGF